MGVRIIQHSHAPFRRPSLVFLELFHFFLGIATEEASWSIRTWSSHSSRPIFTSLIGCHLMLILLPVGWYRQDGCTEYA